MTRVPVLLFSWCFSVVIQVFHVDCLVLSLGLGFSIVVCYMFWLRCLLFFSWCSMHVLSLFFKQIFGYFSFMFAFLWMFNIPYLFGHLVFIIYLYLYTVMFVWWQKLGKPWKLFGYHKYL